MWGLIFSMTLALAQEAVGPEPSPEPPTESASDQASAEALRALTQELEAVRADGLASAAQAEAVDALLAALAVLQEQPGDPSRRVQAVEEVARLGDERALPFLSAELSRSQVPTQEAIALAVVTWPEHPLAKQIARTMAQRPYSLPARRAGFAAIEALGDDPEAMHLLEEIAFDRDEPDEVQDLALQTLRRRYPDYPVGTGVELLADRGAVPIFGYATAMAGGSTLAFVGALGQSDVGVGIGLLGGAIAGGAGGGLYAHRIAMSREESTEALGAVLWGTTLTGMSSSLIEPRTYRQEVMLATGSPALGSLGGLGVAFARPGARSLGDQVEVHVAGTLGLMVGAGAGVAVQDLSGTENAVTVGSLVGAPVGLAAGHLLQDRWDLGPEDVAATSLGSAQGLWVGALLPPLMDRRSSGASELLGFSGGTLAGLLIAEELEVPAGATLANAYGWGAGNALGAGLAAWSAPHDDPDSQVLAGSILATGVVGAVSGQLVAKELEVEPGDAAFMTSSTLWLTGNALSFGAYAQAKSGFDHSAALTLTTLGVAMPATALASQRLEPDPEDVLLAVAGGGWGLWYGAMVPIAIDSSGDAEDLLLAMTLTSDAFVLGSVAATSVPNGLSARRTWIPQLFAVSGATLGALGTSMATQDGPTISGGAVAGSLLGFVAGGVVESKRDTSGDKPLQLGKLGRARLPGTWTPSVAPTVQQDGSLGLTVGLTGVGW